DDVAPDEPLWPTLDLAARHGIAGRIVAAIEPHSEADPAALLIDVLTCAGSSIGAGPHAFADGAQHPARLNAVVVGRSARARKGSSHAQVLRVMRAADEAWTHTAP